MNLTEEINELVYKYKDLGIEKSKYGAELIGRAPHIGKEAWLNKIYPVLSSDEIIQLESELHTDIPNDYKNFLLNFSNGLNILVSTFYLSGLRKYLGRDVEASRQPYSLEIPNVDERPKNAPENLFFIGGYDWDGSRLYIDKKTNLVHCCERRDITPRFTWKSFNEMLISELNRIYGLFDDNGIEKDENIPTIPY